MVIDKKKIFSVTKRFKLWHHSQNSNGHACNLLRSENWPKLEIVSKVKSKKNSFVSSVLGMNKSKFIKQTWSQRLEWSEMKL